MNQGLNTQLEVSPYRAPTLAWMGITIDEIVNHPTAKATAVSLWKMRMRQRAHDERQAVEDKKNYEAWLERQLGKSLRTFLEFGDRFPILKHFRKGIIFLRRYLFDFTVVITIGLYVLKALRLK